MKKLEARILLDGSVSDGIDATVYGYPEFNRIGVMLRIRRFPDCESAELYWRGTEEALLEWTGNLRDMILKRRRGRA